MKRYEVFDEDIKKIKFDDFIVGAFIEAQYVFDVPTYYESGKRKCNSSKRFYVKEKLTGNECFITGLQNVRKYIIEFDLKTFYKLKNKTL